jgi:Tfp pilus assembly protein PilO
MAIDVNVYMNKLKNIKLTKEQQNALVLGVVLVAGGIFGYWRFMLTPTNRLIADYTNKLKEMRQQIQDAKLINMEDYQQRLAKVQAGTQYVSRRLPPADSLAWNLQALVKMSLEGEVWLEKFAADQSVQIASKYEGYQKYGAMVTLATDFHRLGSFLSRLSGEDNIFLVEDLQIREPADDVKKAHNATVYVTMKLVTYAENAR